MGNEGSSVTADQQRFRDQRLTAWHFAAGEVLVRCPRCAECARVVVVPGVGAELREARRLVCGRCGYLRDQTGGTRYGPVPTGPVRDPYLREPLWLQGDCGGNVLWAYNEAHLDYLEAFVGARLREKVVVGEGEWRRRMTMVAKLPAWLKSAKNRESVLRGIQRMRATL
ncbi:TFIIB-type zinc ribbon-containing protein [Amycolatopsis sp. DSM 110486]|uniref:TFIIB-type zinc ribbon-containing protein n=1 Tax=Amycolatopsis sp. DSM 110486 TaxID=2865832 RepID=UPI001C6A3401|nr:TFIIB-type zinc ribbon-containing protein [Amycolatopsis sp. DSM 110486]QYN23534.1 TFIIB-type zinc ribbon-containing protein [Amycolatopsis sp. DSM 110486]